MKKLLFILLIAIPAISFCQLKTPQDTTKQKPVKEFKSGEYTMKQYYFVMLTKGARRNEITDTAVINNLQKGHMANIGKLAAQGKLMVAGPFGDDGNWRGIFIIDADSKEEVEALLKTDPAIAAGRLDYEIHPWWTAKNEVFK